MDDGKRTKSLLELYIGYSRDRLIFVQQRQRAWRERACFWGIMKNDDDVSQLKWNARGGGGVATVGYFYIGYTYI